MRLRLNPTSVKWSYNLVTNVENTYGGQVVQILAVNIGQLTIEGRFGKEGPHGKVVKDGKILEKDYDSFWVIDNNGKYGNGLTQMYEWFIRYFSVATQGGDDIVSGSYDQRPVTLTYGGAGEPHKWKVYPVSMPSYKRSNEDFAPEWQVVCEVEEADRQTKRAAIDEEIANLKDKTGVVPERYSMPPGKDPPQDKFFDVVKKFKEMIPAFTRPELEELMMYNAGLPFEFADLFAEYAVDVEIPTAPGPQPDVDL